MPSDTKSDISQGARESPFGGTESETEVSKQGMPYAFFNHASSPEIRYKLPFSVGFGRDKARQMSLFPLNTTSNCFVSFFLSFHTSRECNEEFSGEGEGGTEGYFPVRVLEERERKNSKTIGGV
jgi:hypothetical protein